MAASVARLSQNKELFQGISAMAQPQDRALGGQEELFKEFSRILDKIADRFSVLYSAENAASPAAEAREAVRNTEVRKTSQKPEPRLEPEQPKDKARSNPAGEQSKQADSPEAASKETGQSAANSAEDSQSAVPDASNEVQTAVPALTSQAAAAAVKHLSDAKPADKGDPPAENAEGGEKAALDKLAAESALEQLPEQPVEGEVQAYKAIDSEALEAESRAQGTENGETAVDLQETGVVEEPLAQEIPGAEGRTDELAAGAIDNGKKSAAPSPVVNAVLEDSIADPAQQATAGLRESLVAQLAEKLNQTPAEAALKNPAGERSLTGLEVQPEALQPGAGQASTVDARFLSAADYHLFVARQVLQPLLEAHFTRGAELRLGLTQLQGEGTAAFQLNDPALGKQQTAQSLADTPAAPARSLPRTTAMRTLEKVEAVLKEAARAHDGSTLTVRLDPPRLGSLRVDVTLRDGALHARLVADSPQVTALLRDKAQDLQLVLRRLGLDVDRVSVSVNHESGAGGDKHTAYGQRPRGKAASRVEFDLDGSRPSVQASLWDAGQAELDHWVA